MVPYEKYIFSLFNALITQQSALVRGEWVIHILMFVVGLLGQFIHISFVHRLHGKDIYSAELDLVQHSLWVIETVSAVGCAE